MAGTWTTIMAAALIVPGARPVVPPPSPTLAASAAAVAAVQGSDSAVWQTYKTRLAILARNAGVHPTTVATYVPGLQVNNSVIRLEAREPGGAADYTGAFKSMRPYLERHVSPNLIRRGQNHYSSHYPALRALELKTGVDPAVTMAIWGHETSYGQVTGSTDLLEALASLGYYGRRRDFFESEFVAALKLIDQGVPRWRLKGSWAGATGYPQFMPSVALRLRADGDGDGYSDIWANELDGLASIANYLRDAGWKPNVPWGIEVRVPVNLNRAAIRSTLTPKRCPAVFRRHSRWLTVREWRSLGVVPTRRSLPDSEMALLLEPEGPGQNGYLLTHNYRAILDYNCSNYYAMSVGLLADRIARR